MTAAVEMKAKVRGAMWTFCNPVCDWLSIEHIYGVNGLATFINLIGIWSFQVF